MPEMYPDAIAIDREAVQGYLAVSLEQTHLHEERLFLEQIDKELLGAQPGTLEQALKLESSSLISKERSIITRPEPAPESYSGSGTVYKVTHRIGEAILRELYRAFCKKDKRYEKPVADVRRTTTPLIAATVGYVAGNGDLSKAAATAAVAAILYLVTQVGVGALCSLGAERFEDTPKRKS